MTPIPPGEDYVSYVPRHEVAGRIIGQEKPPVEPADIHGHEICNRTDLGQFGVDIAASDNLMRFEVLAEINDIVKIRLTYPLMEKDLPRLLELLAVQRPEATTGGEKFAE